MPRARKSTLQDVARHAGVSVGTASGALSNQTSVSEQARAAVLAAAAEIGYRPRRRPGRTLLNGITALGLVAPAEHYVGPGNQFYGPVLHGAQTAAAELGLPLVLETLPKGAGQMHERPLLIERRQTQGLLLAAYLAPEYIRSLVDIDVPCVLVNHRDDSIAVDSVCDDDRVGGYLATKHLLDLGHRDPVPAIISGPQHLFSIRCRLEGYRDALAEAGLAFDPAYVREGDLSPDSGRREMAALFDLPRPPTGVFCCTDMTAFGALDVLRDRTVSVPDECSVIGYDDITMAAHSIPPLTTIAVDKELLGMQAVWHLVERIRQPQIQIRDTTLRVRLVERGSTSGRAPTRKGRRRRVA